MQQAFTGSRNRPIGLECVTGRFNLLFFIQGGVGAAIVPSVGGDVVGQITPLNGDRPIPVIQSQASLNIPLGEVDNQTVTLCGLFVNRGGRILFDVHRVSRPTPAPNPSPAPWPQPQPQPQPVDQNLLLQLLILALMGRTPFGFGKGQFGKGQFGKGQFGKGQFGKGFPGLGTTTTTNHI